MSSKRKKLRSGIETACQPTGAGQIIRGRDAVLAMDHRYVLENIEAVARECLDIEDCWVYRRLLELCEMLDADLTQRVAHWGLDSKDSDVREASEDFTEITQLLTKP